MITKKLLNTARLSFYSIAMTLFKKNSDLQKYKTDASEDLNDTYKTIDPLDITEPT